MPDFAEMLTYLRKREGLSQQELSERMKMSRSAIGMYERGAREPEFETLEAFADFFNVNMDTLLGREKSPPSEDSGPPGYNKLNETNKQIVDTLVSQLLKSQQ